MTIDEIRKLTSAQQYNLLDKPAQNSIDVLIDVLVAEQGANTPNETKRIAEAKKQAIEEIMALTERRTDHEKD